MQTKTELELVQMLAPEDVKPGDYVSIMHVLFEHLPIDSLQSWNKGRTEPVRILWLPWGESTPMKVLEVCLPFLLVKRPGGKHSTLDLRRYRLARVSEQFGRKVFKRLRENRQESELE